MNIKLKQLFIASLAFVTYASCTQEQPDTEPGRQGLPAELLRTLLDEWETSITKDALERRGDLGEKLLEEARKQRSPWIYIASADHQDGIKAEKAVLDEAASLFPDVDGPHFALAEFYYKLAFFDIIRGGLFTIERVPTGDFSKDDLYNTPLALEIQLLTSSSSPNQFAQALQSSGISDTGISTYLLSIISSESEIEGLRELLPKIIESEGRPPYLPVTTWKPDEQTKELLRLAQSEIRAAYRGIGMEEPEDLRAISRDRMAKFADRINELLGESNSWR